MQSVDIITAKPKKKQAYGEPVWGSSDEQLLETPDAETIGDPQELFPMGGGPSKASGNFFQNFGQVGDLVRRWFSRGKKDAPQGTPAITEETKTSPTPQLPKQSDGQKQDTAVVHWIWKDGRNKSGRVYRVSRDSAKVWVQKDPDVEYHNK